MQGTNNKKNKDNSNDNVFTIKSSYRSINDDDINNLIMGIVGLIKKSTAYTIHNQYKSVISDYRKKLNSVMSELNNKNKLLLEVLEENQKLKDNNGLTALYRNIKGN